jgi:GTPase SAR1 family protein
MNLLFCPLLEQAVQVNQDLLYDMYTILLSESITLQCKYSVLMTQYNSENTYHTLTAIGNNSITLEIFDTSSGWGDFRDQRYRASHGFIVLHSITDKSTFEDSRHFCEWLLKIKDVDSFPMVLVGTKWDLETERTVSRRKAETLANKYQMNYFEVSSKEGVGVREVMMDIVLKIKFGVGYNEVFQRLEAGKNIITEPTKEKGKKCTIC